MTRQWVFVAGFAVMLCLSGCSSTPGLQVMLPRVFDQLDVPSSAAMASASDGAVLMATDTRLLRIDPKKRTVETIFEGSSQNQLSDVAVSENGLVYVADHNRLTLFAGEQLHDLLQGSNPSQGWLLSTYAHTDLYLCSRKSRGNDSTLFHYNTQTKQIRGLAEFDRPITAIAGVRGGCLVATKNTIYKIFQGDDSAEVISLMVCSVKAQDRQIVSLAADEAQRAVYFTTEDGVWAYVDGHVVPLLPAGGQLAFAGDTLTLWDNVARQLLQIKAPATRARKILQTM